jgi:SecD/SecF fusion protein
MNILIFLIGILAFGLFVWYFASETENGKRKVGTLLALIMIAFGAYMLVSKKMKQGIDLAGGAAFRVKIDPAVNEDGQTKTVTTAQAEAAKEIIERRLAPLGNKDIVVTVQGQDEIYVEVPGIQPEEMAKNREIIERVAKLDFRLVHPNGQALIDQRGEAIWNDAKKQWVGVAEPGYVEVPDHHKIDAAKKKAKEEGKVEPEADISGLDRDAQLKKRLEDIYKKKQTILVKKQPELEGKSVSQAFAAADTGTGGYMIHVKLNSADGDKMLKITKENLGQPLAIVVDGEVISAPTIQGNFGADFQITGGSNGFDFKEANDLSSALMNPLENPLRIVQASQTSPTYGKAIIQQGMLAGLAGLVATLVFMCIYYRLSGIIAVIGLAVNLLLLLAAMNIFDFTLTMPGIAGIVLTLGIAVDANVLIYERMREEFAAGKTFHGALNASYQKAFSAIFDSNLTSLITSVIMIWLATGAVKGFGVTLTVGILASLFSALLITRVCFGWLERTGLKKLSFMSLIQNRLINFMGKRKLAFAISGVLIAACLAILVIKRDKSLGYELRGGELISLTGVTEDQVRTSLSKLQTVKTDEGKEEGFSFTTQSIKPIGGQEASVNVRTNFGLGKGAIDHLQNDLKVKINADDLQQIGPAVGKQSLYNSLWAILLGMVGIFIYLTFRYEVPFAIGGIVALLHDVIISAGVCAFFGIEIGMIVVGALLTIAGYSINDTIVIFDRIRETLRNSRDDLEDIMNQAISATLSRTILTSGVTLFVVLSMLVFGGKSMTDFSFCMLVGMISGVYSTIFIASPIVLWWARKRKLNLRKAIMDAEMLKLQAQSNVEREVIREPKKA